MNKKLKIILTILVLIGIYYLAKSYPDEVIIIAGIGLIVIIGMWLMEVEKKEIN